MEKNWELELKKYVARKHKEATGEELPLDFISDIKIDFDVALDKLSIKDLGNMYSFCLMMENYEHADKIHNELCSRNCVVELNLDEKRKTGIIDISYNENKSIENIEINMKIVPSGLIVDFDKLD